MPCSILLVFIDSFLLSLFLPPFNMLSNEELSFRIDNLYEHVKYEKNIFGQMGKTLTSINNDVMYMAATFKKIATRFRHYNVL